MLLPTSTWMAYNDWGGGNHYAGTDGPTADLAAPQMRGQPLRRPESDILHGVFPSKANSERVSSEW